MTAGGAVAGDQRTAVLVVDDEPYNVDLLTQELAELGIRTLVAANGREALERLDGEPVDAVLLDLMMPEMDGFQVLERLGATGRLAELPVIVVSAVDDIERVARCIELGAEDHLLKPFDPVLLRARIGGALEKKRLRDQVASQLAATREIFGRYVPEAVAGAILAGRGTMAPVQTEATVLCCDIEGFTRIVERLSPDRVLRMLNDYFAAVIDQVRLNGGVVNQFVGDAMLVTFNVPAETPGHGNLAVRTAIGIQSVLADGRFAGQRLAARIGINTGSVVAGIVGAAGRLHYTVLGDAVNVAARLEELNKERGTDILISGTTAGILREDFPLQRLGDVQVRGKLAPVTVYRLATRGRPRAAA